MIKLKRGDIVDVIAPASFNQSKDLLNATDLLESWGLTVRTSIDFDAFHPFHSDDDESRFLDLKRAILAGDSKMIWSIRGGYGSQRLLSQLAKIKKPKYEKIIVGYSDITSLHLFFNQKWNWATIHGPMINSFNKKDFNPIAFKELKKILFDKKSSQKIKLEPLNDSATIFFGSAALCGGNLSVLQCSMGTAFELVSKNKILIIEDVGERGYKVDKMLYHLQLTKALNGVKAIIFGDFVSGDEPTGENYIDFALRRFALSTKIPVFKCMDFGHGLINRPLIFNGSPKTTIRKSILTIEG